MSNRFLVFFYTSDKNLPTQDCRVTESHSGNEINQGSKYDHIQFIVKIFVQQIYSASKIFLSKHFHVKSKFILGL